MRTSRRLLRQVRRAMFVAFLFSGCVNILMLATPLYTLQIFETVVPVGSVETLVVLTLIAAGAILALSLIEMARDRIMLRAGVWLDHELGRFVIENGVRAGSTPADLKADARALAQFRTFITSGALGPLFDAPFVPLFLIILAVLHPLLGIVATIAAALLFVAALLHTFATSRVQLETTRAGERAEQWWSTVAGTGHLAGALGLGPGAARQWETVNRAHVAGTYSHGKRVAAVKVFARFVRISSQIGLYGVGAGLIIAGEIAPGALVASAILLARALAPIEQLVGSIRTIRSGLGAYARLKALPPDAVVPELDDAAARPEGHILLSDVTVIHPGRKTPALRQISLELAPGACLGIVGPNGSGKSTLAAVIAGAVIPSSGSADLDGIPVAKWQRWEGLPPVGYLPEEASLIDGTVHANIARFREASINSVARAASLAGIEETIRALPAGYDTPVGPGGSALSARERRAVALARALHGDPLVLVLDEPEIGLDGAGMRRLVSVLRELKTAGVGLVIATQDPRLLELADHIAVLVGGTLQSFGSGPELASRFQEQRREPAPAGLH